jgi:hypothetical protein
VSVYDPDKHCGGQRANEPEGVLCTRPKGWGTPHPGVGRCKRHAGSTANHVKAASLEIAKRECATLGLAVETTPADALIQEVWEACGNVEFYRSLIQELPTHPEPDVHVAGDESDGSDHWERGDTGIYGRTYHVSGLPTGEGKEHILLRLYNDERKRKLEAASAALRAGVDERRVRLAEADATWITAAFVQTLETMGLAGRVEEFRALFNANLAASTQPAHLGAAGAG